MLIYFVELATNARLSLCWTPDEIKCGNTTNFKTFDLIDGGERKIPKGIQLTTFEWSGVLPGEANSKQPFIYQELWHPPKQMQQIFSRWRTSGTKLKLVITDTPINHNVYIDEYNVTYKGPSGDYYYDIKLSYAPDVVVKSVDEVNDIKASLNTNDSRLLPASASNKDKTYKVKSGDSLWAIAQDQLGKGSRYNEIFELNKDKLKNVNSTIYPGMILTLPTQ